MSNVIILKNFDEYNLIEIFMKNIVKIMLSLCLFMNVSFVAGQQESIKVETYPTHNNNGNVVSNKLLFLDSNEKVVFAKSVYDLNPFNFLPYKKIGIIPYNGNEKYLITKGEYQQLFPDSSLRKYRADIIDQARSIDSFNIRSNQIFSVVEMPGVTKYKYIAVSFSMEVRPVNGELIVGAKSKVLVFSSDGNIVFDEVTDRYVNSIAVTQDGRFLAYTLNSGWADDELYPSSLIIKDIETGKIVLENNGGENYFVWQITGAIGWSGSREGIPVDYYYLESGKIIIVKNDLPFGISEIRGDSCIFIRNDGATFSRLISSSMINNYKN